MDGPLTQRLEAMIRENPGWFDGLCVDDLQRASDWLETSDSVTFTLERHPHVLGRRSSGYKSSFFRRQLTRYKFDGSEISDEVVSSSVEWDANLLVAEEFAFLDGDCDAFRELLKNATEPTLSEVSALLERMNYGYREALKDAGAAEKFDELWLEFFPAMVAYAHTSLLRRWHRPQP